MECSGVSTPRTSSKINMFKESPSPAWSAPESPASQPEREPDTRSLEVESRVAELLLPGMKRDFLNVPWSERAAVKEDIKRFQKVLGIVDDIPEVRLSPVNWNRERLGRTHTWSGPGSSVDSFGGVESESAENEPEEEDPKQDTDKEPEEEDPVKVRQRVAALLLPGLKRDFWNAPRGERAHIAEDIEKLQKVLAISRDQRERSETWSGPASSAVENVADEVMVSRRRRGSFGRQTSWSGPESSAGAFGELGSEGAGKEPEEEDPVKVSHRVAALLLPGLKRNYLDAPFEERPHIAEEIKRLQKVLGVEDDTPEVRVVTVSRKVVRSQTWGTAGEFNKLDIVQEAEEVATKHEDPGKVSKRIAEMLLPGLKRDYYNTPYAERAHIGQEIERLQKVLGADNETPNVRVPTVSPRKRIDGEVAISRGQRERAETWSGPENSAGALAWSGPDGNIADEVMISRRGSFGRQTSWSGPDEKMADEVMVSRRRRGSFGRQTSCPGPDSSVGAFGELGSEDADKEPEEEDPVKVSERIAALLLPGLKRDYFNASWAERTNIAKEIQELEKVGKKEEQKEKELLEQDAAKVQEKHVAALLLPGLKRDFFNAPSGDRSPILKDIENLQKVLTS